MVLVAAVWAAALPFLEVRRHDLDAPPTPIADQTGFQLITGKVSPIPIRDPRRLGRMTAEEVAGLDVSKRFAEDRPADQGGVKVRPAPLFTAVIGLLLGAALLGVTFGSTALRVSVVGAMLAAALALVFVQMAQSFPLDSAVRAEVRHELERQRGANDVWLGPPDSFVRLKIETHHTVWFWVWGAVLLVALGLLVAESVVALVCRDRWGIASGPR